MHRDAAHRLPARGVPAELRREAVAAWDGALELAQRRLPQLAGHRAGADRHDRFHDGLRHHRDRAGPRPGQDQAPGRRRHDQDRQRHRAARTRPARLLPAERDAILAHLEATGTVEGAPGIKDEHLPVFDCAFKPVGGERYLTPLAHLRMMGAVQPFLSGAISKTVNIPEETPPEEIERLYVEGWKLGLKSIAVYRDNCKGSQPLGTSDKQIVAAVGKPTRASCRTSASRSPTSSRSRGRRATSPSASTRRQARRAVHHDGQGGVDALRRDGRLRHRGLADAAIRRAARVPGQQVLARPLRAVGLDQQRPDPVREVGDRLHLPLDGVEVPLTRGTGRGRRPPAAGG